LLNEVLKGYTAIIGITVIDLLAFISRNLYAAHVFKFFDEITRGLPARCPIITGVTRDKLSNDFYRIVKPSTSERYRNRPNAAAVSSAFLKPDHTNNVSRQFAGVAP